MLFQGTAFENDAASEYTLLHEVVFENKSGSFSNAESHKITFSTRYRGNIYFGVTANMC